MTPEERVRAAMERFDAAEVALGQALAEHHHARIALLDAFILGEREACARIALDVGPTGDEHSIAAAIRGRR